MADRVLFIGWNRIILGREKQVAQFFQKSLEFYGKLTTDGRIESFDMVLLSPHGGDLNGFVMLRGSTEKLAKLREDNDFQDQTIEADMCLDGLGVIPGYIGEGLMDIMSRWTKKLG